MGKKLPIWRYQKRTNKNEAEYSVIKVNDI